MPRSTQRIGQVVVSLFRMWRELRRAGDSDRPAILRQTLETLSGTFVKFGQVLALRPDLLPRNYCYELFRLLDQVPPFPYEAVCAIVENDLGQPPSELFQCFDRVPLASASFGQVHRAITAEGDFVAVKVQRPGIRQLVETDLRIMTLFSLILDRSGILGIQKMKPTLDEFARLTRQELDYTIEARHNDQLYYTSQTNFKQKIPRTYWKYISSRVLTNEYLDGILLSQIMSALYHDDQEALAAYQERHIDLLKISQNLWECFGEQAYLHDTFHADPHPANIIVLDDNVLGYVDFGIVGSMSNSLRTKIMRLVRAGAERDFERAADIFLEIVPPTPRTDLETFRHIFIESMRAWNQIVGNKHIPFRERSFSAIFVRQMQMIHKYHLQATPDTLAYFRTVLAVDSITLQIAPDFDSSSHALVFFHELDRRAQSQIQHQLQSPESIRQMLYVYAELFQQLPHVLSDLFTTFQDNRPQGHWAFWHQQHAQNARTRVMTLGMILVSIALTLNMAEGHEILTLPLLNILFGMLVVVGVCLVIALKRLS
jgi:ubiquinone biosynthesis protein